MTARKFTDAGLGAIVRQLTDLLMREARALATADFQAFSSLQDQKERLTAAIEDLVAADERAVAAGDLQALQRLQALAFEQAADIARLREGAAHARRRLQQIAVSAASSGVYGIDGRPLPFGRPASVGRNA